MTTETNNTKPLYKVLNEQRTQGIWTVGKNRIEDYPETYNLSRSYRKGHICIDAPTWEQMAIFYRHEINENDKETECNVSYTALAVNNLASLAEALEPFIKLADAVLADTLKTSESPLYGYNDVVLYVKDLVAAKEALRKIS